jgi:crotonyl-CoA carboxylase/reductase
MVVICAGTTGYSAVVDLRYHWVRQKRLQGSHGTNDEQARRYNELVRSTRIDPCLGAVMPFAEIGRAHQLMADGELAYGNTSILIGAASTGLGRKETA